MPSSSLILAALLTPAMAYAGLGAAALPILIHLLNRRRFRRVRWAATEFLLEAERRNRRRMRLEELVLLAMRCVAMGLIGLVLARMFVRPQSLFGSLGAGARTDHIIVIDDSYSMGVQQPSAAGIPTGPRSSEDADRSPAVFDAAKAAATSLIRHIREAAPEDSVAILLASRPDQPVQTATSVGKVPLQTWNDEIKAMQRSHRAGNMQNALKAVRAQLDGRQSTLRAAVYMVSDFEAVDWLSANEGAAVAGQQNVNAGPAAALVGWAARDRSLDVLLVDVGRHVPSNLAVADIQSEQAQAVAGVAGRYHVRIFNYGDEASRPGQMQVFMGDAALPPVPVPALPANQSAEVPVELAFGQEGSQRLTVELGPDALPEDNTRSAALDVVRALRLLLVNGEASPDPYQDEAHLVSIALRPEGPEFSGNETTIINESELEVADLASYHAVLLLNVNRVTDQVRSRLEAYAAGGGGVVFFLGDQVDANAYNRLLYHNGAGLLPAMIGDASTAPAQQPGYRLEASEVDTPITRKLGGASAALLGSSLVWQWFHCEPPASQPESASASGDPAASQRAERGRTQVLLRLSDQEHSPVLLGRAFGRGRVLLFTTSADKEWNNLADQPVFVVLMLELMQQIARPASDGGEQLVGEPIHLPVDLAVYEPSATLKLPTYPGVPAIRIEARTDATNGRSLLDWADTNRPGLYTFELRKTSGETVVRQIAVNLDARESDLRRADRAALLASMSGLRVTHVPGDSLENLATGEARRELWPALLAVLAGLLMLEQALAWWFGAGRDWRRAFRRPASA